MPVIFPVSKPSSMCWVRFNTWAVQDLPGRKPACSGISPMCSIMGDRRGGSVSGAHTVCRGTQKGNWSEAVPGFRREQHVPVSRVTVSGVFLHTR